MEYYCCGGCVTGAGDLMHGFAGNGEFPTIELTADVDNGQRTGADRDLEQQVVFAGGIAAHRALHCQCAGRRAQRRVARVGARGRRGPQHRHRIAGEFDDVAAVGLHNVDQPAEEIVQDMGERLGAIGALVGERFGEGRKTGDIREQHRALHVRQRRSIGPAGDEQAIDDQRRHVLPVVVQERGIPRFGHALARVRLTLCERPSVIADGRGCLEARAANLRASRACAHASSKY